MNTSNLYNVDSTSDFDGNEHQEKDLYNAVVGIVQHPGMKVKRGLVEYIAESEHNSWEGFNQQDVNSITKFLVDLSLFLQYSTGVSEYFDTNYKIQNS